MRCVQKRVAVIKTIAEVAHTIFSHIQVHKYGWKKFEHPKSILSTAKAPQNGHFLVKKALFQFKSALRQHLKLTWGAEIFG